MIPYHFVRNTPIPVAQVFEHFCTPQFFLESTNVGEYACEYTNPTQLDKPTIEISDTFDMKVSYGGMDLYYNVKVNEIVQNRIIAYEYAYTEVVFLNEKANQEEERKAFMLEQLQKNKTKATWSFLDKGEGETIIKCTFFTALEMSFVTKILTWSARKKAKKLVFGILEGYIQKMEDRTGLFEFNTNLKI